MQHRINGEINAREVRLIGTDGEIIGVMSGREAMKLAEEADTDLVEITESILQTSRTDIATRDTLSMPIAQLATLGAGVSSLIPALRTVTQTISSVHNGFKYSVWTLDFFLPKNR